MEEKKPKLRPVITYRAEDLKVAEIIFLSSTIHKYHSSLLIITDNGKRAVSL